MDSLTQIERFRQLQNELKRKNDFLLVGLDVAKKTVVACIISSENEIYLKKFSFTNTKEGILKLIIKAEEIKNKYNKTNIILGFEPTGNYHKPLANFLYNQKYDICIVSSTAAKNNRKALHSGRWRKNDPEDAYNIADMMKQGKILYYDATIDNSKRIKDLAKLRKKLSKKLASLKVMVRNNIFAKFFPEIDSVYKEIDCPEIICLLKNFPTAEHIRKTTFFEFNTILKSATRLNTHAKKQRIETIWNKAQSSIGCSYHKSLGIEIGFLLENFLMIKKQLKSIDQEIQTLCKDLEEYKILTSIPGFGHVYASLFLSYIPNINMFKNASQIIKMAGLDLEYYDSGETNSKRKVSKKGNVLLRIALSGAAKASLKNSTFKTWYYNHLKRKGVNAENKRILKVKLAAKIARIAFALLKNKESFDIRYIN